MGVEGAAAYHHSGVADQAVKHRVHNHEEQDPDHGGVRLARGGPSWWQIARCEAVRGQATVSHGLDDRRMTYGM